MFLAIFLIVATSIGMVYGIAKKNKPILIVSIIAFVIVAILLAVYSYLYKQNPY